MLKNICKLECKVGDNEICLLCDNTTPITAVKEACFQFIKYVGQVEDALAAQQKAQQEAQPTDSKTEKVEPIPEADYHPEMVG